jgi:CRP-like cAMP-binding protein
MIIDESLRHIIKNHTSIKRIFKKGQRLFEENSESRGVYFIEEGNVKLFRLNQKGEERVIYFAGCGELLGVHPVVNNHPYVTTAIAVSDTRTYFIGSADFMDLIGANSAYRLLVMKSLCSRLNSIETHIAGINEKITEERLADTLLMLIDKYGINKSNALNIGITIDELASLTCTSKSYMKKIIYSFSQKGLLGVCDDTIRILNLPEIKNIANLP